MEEQIDLLHLETGTKEATTLEPKKVKIVKISVEEVGDKGNKKAVFEVKHPDKEETIRISSVKYETKTGKLSVSGTWVNLDDEDKLRKGSALANLIAFLNCKVLKEVEGKEAETSKDDSGYLCFKAY